MPYKVGETIIVCSDMENINSMQEYIITQVREETLRCGENVFYTSFCWPIQYKQELHNILKIRQQLKKQLDDSMALVYNLRNKIGLNL